MDIAKRFRENPLLKPQDLAASAATLQVICLLNPGVFTYQHKTYLLVRVAESVAPQEGKLFIPMRMANDHDQALLRSAVAPWRPWPLRSAPCRC